MKKFLGILVIAATLVACNNSGEGSTNPDSLNNANAVDTTPIINTPVDTNTVMPVDTTNRTGDTTTRR